jgi:hypothetical protein
MSANALAETGGIYSYDFTTGPENAYGGNLAQKEIGPGIWGMTAGDADADGHITIDDKSNIWSILAGKAGYLPGDYNLDANINNQDKNDFWRSNISRETQVPE